jgi:UPF0716 protein FxsA
MSLVKWIVVGLLSLPLAEIVAFVAVAALIGPALALVFVLATSLAGFALLRLHLKSNSVRLRTADGRIQFTAASFDSPGLPVTVAAILLIIPGFLTDVLALALLVPETRRRLAAVLSGGRYRGAKRGPAVVDLDPGEWRRERDPVLQDDREGRERRD